MDADTSATLSPEVTEGTKQSYPGNLTSSFILSYLIGALMVVSIIAIAGPWDFLAITRFMDFLINAGIIQFHDMNPGFIEGIPEAELYMQSQDPINWLLVIMAGILLMVYAGLKAVQYHRVARAYELPGTFGQHARAYLYGDGLDRILPFNIGTEAAAETLAHEGVSRDRAIWVYLVTQVFTVFEIIVFAIIGLFILGWSSWLSQILWALIILGAVYYIVCSGQTESRVSVARRFIGAGIQAFRGMAHDQPGEFLKMCFISILAFGFLDLGVYLVMMAFNSPVNYIYYEPQFLLMGVVGGYIARLVHYTPGGIGQWELGFATGLYIGGVDLSVALVSIAFLANLLRIITGYLLMAVCVLGFGVPTNLREVLNVFARERQVQEE